MRASFLVAIGLVLAAFGIGLASEKRPEKGAYSFAVIGHVMGNGDGHTNPLLDELLDELRRVEPDLVFLTGDMVWGYVGRPAATVDEKVVTADWDRLDSKLSQLGVPVYRVPGNHDINYPATRDVYFRRYGELPQVITYRGSRFILLNSAAVPEGDGSAPYEYFRGKQLDPEQIGFIRYELSQPESFEHAFLFMHHLLWWSEDAEWWRGVHSLLAGRKVRAVFGGDHGPMKFSHLRRDGIDYIQSGIEDVYSIENPKSLELLLEREADRLLAQQFDNFILVRVDGPEVHVEVKTVGAMTSGKLSPQRFREVYGDVGHAVPPRPPGRSFSQRVWDIIGTPRRLGSLALLVGVCYLAGAVSAAAWNRRKAARRSSSRRDDQEGLQAESAAVESDV